jgi:hypothetical protein
MRKATAVKLTPKDSCDKINVDGEVPLFVLQTRY